MARVELDRVRAHALRHEALEVGRHSLSFLPTMYQLGLVFHAGVPIGALKRSDEGG